jgi:hypothetical protein
MKALFTIQRSVIAMLILSCELVLGQTAFHDQATQVSAAAVPVTDVQNLKLSPGAQEVAADLGLMTSLDRLFHLSEGERCGASPTLEALTLKQSISDKVLSASLEIDGAFAEIDYELGRIEEARNQLEERRDRALKINNLAGIVTGGLSGVVSTALQFKDSTMQAGNVVGVGAGAFSTFLSILGIRQQTGGHQTLNSITNMLAKILNRPPKEHSDYPQEVWLYLSAKPPTESGPESRIERLKNQWVKDGRIDSNPSRAAKKIDLLTDTSSSPQKMTLDLLNDRAAMLADVRVRVSLMKRDLSKLLLTARCN